MDNNPSARIIVYEQDIVDPGPGVRGGKILALLQLRIRFTRWNPTDHDFGVGSDYTEL